MAKVEAIQYGDRKVYSVASFNHGVAEWLQRLPTVWVEGEVTELRRNARWQSVFFTLKDPSDGACLGVTIARSRFDALRLDLANGERVHAFGRPELFEARGDFRLRALSIERFGLGDHLAALERLKQKLAAEGVFERKRRLPALPRAIGLVTGNDAAAKRDVLTTITARFPAARIVVAETYVQGPLAAGAMIDALRRVCAVPEVDVIVLTRGGGSFEDLLPFSDEAPGARRRRVHGSRRLRGRTRAGHSVCAISLPMRAHRRRRRRPDSLSPMRTSCSPASSAPAAASHAARAPCSTGGGSDSCTRTSAAPRTVARCRAQARASRARGGPAARAVAARDTRPWLRDRSSGRRDRSFRRFRQRRRPARRRGRRRPLWCARRVSAEPTFEDAQRELEQIVERLERGDAGLDEAIKLWERGEELYKLCVGKLDAAQGKIEELARRADSAKP